MTLAKWFGIFLIRTNPSLLARSRTAAPMLFETIKTAEKQFVAVHIRTVVIHLIRSLAVGANANDFPIFAQRNDQPIIENKQLSLPVLRALFEAILNDAPIELIDLFKPFFFQ